MRDLLRSSVSIMVLATAVLWPGPASAQSEPAYEVLWTLGKGPRPTGIGNSFDTGSEVYLVGVDESGNAFLYDDGPREIVAVSPGAASIMWADSLVGPGRVVVDNSSAALGRGRFALLVHEPKPATLRIYEMDGRLVAQREVRVDRLFGRLPSGNILTGTITDDSKLWVEYDQSLDVVAQYTAAPPTRIGLDRVIIRGKPCTVIEAPTLCVVVDDGAEIGARVTLSGGRLQFATTDSVGTIAMDGTVTSWVLPPTRARKGRFPPEYDWDVVGSAVSLDGRYYSLVLVNNKKFQLVRWNTGALPRKRFQAPPSSAPILRPIPAQSTSVGRGVTVEITADNATGERPTYAVSGAPATARFLPNYAVWSAALIWAPGPEDVGHHEITVTATNHACGKATMKLSIDVRP